MNKVPDFDVSGLRRDLAELSTLSQTLGRSLGRTLASALLDGRRLSDALRGMALSLSRQAVSRSLSDLGAGLLKRALPANPLSIIMNVMTPDAGAFRRSEKQVMAAILRALTRGRGLL